MNTECIATTAYNPQADGQSERTNQVVEIALQHVVNDPQSDWSDFIGMIPLEMNNAPNATTGISPNMALMGYNPKTVVQLPTSHIQLNVRTRCKEVG